MSKTEKEYFSRTVRKKVLALADYIIPGHGGMFKVKQ